MTKVEDDSIVECISSLIQFATCVIAALDEREI